MLFVPVGLDETRISRLPVVSIAILAVNVAVFLGMAVAGGEEAVEARFREVVEYWSDRPYLELPAELESRFGLSRERLAQATGTRLPVAAPDRAQAEQERLDALCADLLAAVDELPVRRWSLVPARGLLQPGWITHQFLHGGLGHLLGNMLVFFLVVGPFLEDAWGRPFFLAFYLVGGVLAGAAQALPMGDSQTHVLGASGAISACLGAFALRLAHRRVRMFYWVAFFFRGTFFVPAWAYAFFGLAMDLLGLRMAGTGGGVAYAAHVGGFAFGIGAVLAVRATGLEDRIAPEGAVRWGRTAEASRGAEALADGRRGDAVRHLERAVARDPGDRASLLALARLHAAGFDPAATTPLVERLLGASFAANDRAGARELLLELGAAIDPAALRPALAYRAAEAIQADDPALADRLDEVAGGGGGLVAAKALLRAAERSRERDPARMVELATRARDAEGASPELRARADELLGERGSPAPARNALDGSAIRLVHCRLLGSSEAGLDLATEAGKRALLPPARIEALASAVVSDHERAGRRVRNAVLLDLLLHPRVGEAGRVVLRLLGHEMALGAIRPGVAPKEAFGQVVDALVLASGAAAAPSPEGAAGRPFATYPDAGAFEEAAWGRRLGG